MRILFAALAIIIINTSAATAQVIVNGRMLSAAEIASLANYSCGWIPPGRYWLDRAGYYGYDDGSQRLLGHIRDRCRTRRKSLSERRMLYRPGEILSGR